VARVAAGGMNAARPTSPPTESLSARWRSEAEDARPHDEPAVDLEPVKRSMPSWLISLIIHTVLLLILAMISSPVGQGISRVVLEFGEATQESPVDLAVFDLKASESMQDNPMAESDLPVDLELESMEQSLSAEDLIADTPIEIGEGPTIDAGEPMFSGRTGAMKQALLATYGGNEETVEAVDLGLRWLARQQHKPSGSWSLKGPYDNGAIFENRSAATAMALLAFLGDGHTHQKGEYANVVAKGLRFLLSEQDRNGFFAGSARGDDRAYAQAQATIAICEAYALTNDSELKAPAQIALDWAVEAQSSEGGWRYKPRFDSDLSVTGWYVMALVSGQAAGLRVDGSVLKMAERYLGTVQADEGATYGYKRGRPSSPAMTAEGLLCRQYLGWPRDHPAMGLGVTTLLNEFPFNTKNRNVYYWYYATQVMHHFGDSPWRIWNDVMREELPKLQVRRGLESGSWSPQADQWGRQAGRLYTTCLSIYCLEVYYRHLPLYQMAGE